MVASGKSKLPPGTPDKLSTNQSLSVPGDHTFPAPAVHRQHLLSIASGLQVSQNELRLPARLAEGLVPAAQPMALDRQRPCSVQEETLAGITSR